jgi:DNA (cytosine-5)-methyltransferase 1
MRIGSLFSGAGGLDMAVEQVFGGHTVWHSEVDPAASKVLAHRWPGVPNLGDITTIGKHPKVGWGYVEPVDILCGGYPCQPFSAAGQRKGTNDERHLWPHFAEAIRVLRPRYVVLENVAGHRSMGLSSVLADLAGIGYVGSWCSLRASDVGAPHRRERVFVVAYPHNGTGHGQRSRPESRQGSAAPTDARDRTVPERPWPAGRQGEQRVSVGSIPGCGGAGTVDDLLPTPRSSDCFGPGLHGDGGMDLRTTVTLLPTPTAGDGMAGGSRTVSDGNGGRRPVDWDDTTRSTGDGGASRLRDVPPLIHGSQWGKYEPAIRRWEQVTRPAPAPTEPNTKGNPRLSARFSEWLMGWPDGWVTDIEISRNDQLRIVGNGVVPQCAAAALRWLLTVSEIAA